MLRKYTSYNFSDDSYRIIYEPDEFYTKDPSKEVLNSGDFSLKTEENVTISKGLYDTKVFGTLNQCVCKKTKNSGFCPYCKTRVLPINEYKKQHGFYRLKYPFAFSTKLKLLLNNLSEIGINLLGKEFTSSTTDNEKIIQQIWSLEFKILTNKAPKGNLIINNEDNIIYIMGDGTQIKISYITEESDPEFIGLTGLKKLANYKFKGEDLSFINNYINQIIYIQSPALRPPAFFVENGKRSIRVPQQTVNYKILIECDKIIRNFSENINPINLATILSLYNILQNRIIYNSKLLATSKQSLLRNALNVRIDLTLRGNISPNNSLQINEIGIPKSSLYLMLQHQIISKLKENKDDMIALNAEYYYLTHKSEAYEVMYSIVKDSCALFQRSPVLHKYGVFAFKVVIIESDKPVIQMNPLIATPFNADYDGDQMLVILEIDPYNARRFLQKINPKYLWTYDKGGDPIWVPEHEILVGLIYASNIDKRKNPKKYNNFEILEKDIENRKLEIDEEILFKNKKTSYGRLLLDRTLGVPLDYIIGKDNILSSKNIGLIIAGLKSKENRLEIINELIAISNKFATEIGIDTPPRANLFKNLEPEINKIKNDPNLTEEQKYNKINQYIEKGLTENIKNLSKNNNFEIIMNSSGRVKMQQLKGLYSRKVYRNLEGETVVGDSEIMSGLSEKDLFIAAREARSVFKIKKDSVPISGYNTRQLVVKTNNISYSSGKAPEIGFIKIPKDNTDFEGRNIVKSDNYFNYYQSMVGRKLDYKIYSDEIRKERFVQTLEDTLGNKYEVEAQIAQSFSQIITERISQSLLGLKYGADLQYIENESTLALFDGKIKEQTEEYLIVEDDVNKEWKYILTEASSVPRILKPGTEFKKGDTLILSNIVRLTENKMGPISEFLGFQVAGGKIKEENAVTYSVSDAVVHYTKKNIIFGEIQQRINQNLIYFYPEGWKIKYGDRVSSGILNLKTLFKYGTASDLFYIFYKEFHSILSERNGWGNKIEPELIEPLFTIINQSTGKSIKSMARERTDILDSMYGESPNMAFETGTMKTPLKNRVEQEFKSTFISDLLLRLNS